MVIKQKYAFFIFMTILGLSIRIWAHGQHHEENTQSGKQGNAVADRSTQLKEINLAYLEKIRPIFQRKCFDCHSDQTKYPWYHKIPGVRTLIDRDVSEGRKHLDLSKDFPFAGHGTVEDDLKAIRESILDGSMPPIAYRVMHLSSKLSEEDKEQILEWVSKGEVLLHQTKK